MTPDGADVDGGSEGALGSGGLESPVGATWIAIVISTVDRPAPGVPCGAVMFIAVAKLDVELTSNA